MTKNIVITGASSGSRAMTAWALADAGHSVYAGCAILKAPTRRPLIPRRLRQRPQCEPQLSGHGP
jgi:NAD(P)-dependent dehydrogenase (short-subunit alcohol dehydrogenase family)